MAGETYRIQYNSLDDLEFKSRAAVEKYLKEEEAVWQEFLLWFVKDEKLTSAGLQVRNFGRSFENMLSNLENATGFNRQFPFSRNNVLLPPPSRTLSGQLILGLFNNGEQHEAISVYLWFISLEAHKLPGNLGGRKEQGAALVAGAKAAEALPFHQISSQKLAGAARMAEAHAAAMAEEVEGAERERETLTETMSHMAESWSRTFETNQKLVEVREERQSLEFDLSLKEFKSTFDGEMIQIEESFRARMSEHALEQEAHGARYEELLDKFLVQMQYRAPVKLWGDRQEGHIEASGKAFKRFLGFACVAVLIALLVPYLAGDYIAESFYQPQGAKQVFSVKGPLTIAGLLLVMSLVLWGIRLQYRVYLSERHLALDAAEKKAFAQTFLALREDKSVGADNEAIVLASLFRPTQDGIIRDDEASLDISAAALLAKQLGNRN